MTKKDLSPEEAARIAVKLGVTLLEQDGVFVVYRMVPAKPDPTAPTESEPTTPLQQVEVGLEVGRGPTRRAALAKAQTS